MSKSTNKKETRKEKDNLNVNCGQTAGDTNASTKVKTAKGTSSISSPEDWPTLDATANEKEEIVNESDDRNNNNSDSKEKSFSDEKVPKKNGQLMKQSSGEVQSNGVVVSGKVDATTNNAEESSQSGGTCDHEEDSSEENKDEAQSSSGTSATSEKQNARGENSSTTAGNKKKGSKNRWRPLVIEPQNSKHHERRGQRPSRRREAPPSNAENGGLTVEEEARTVPSDKSYRGSRRGRGRGFSNSGRPSFRGRGRNFEGNRSQSMVINDEYSTNVSYYVNYDVVADQTTATVATVRNNLSDQISPASLAQPTAAAFITPTGTVPTAAYVSPFFTPYAPLSTSSYDPETLRNCIRNQVEYYFSEENLQRDFFLRRKMDSEGFLPISLIASFQRVQALTKDVEMLIEALENSEVDISEDRLRVRAKHDPLKWPIFDTRFKTNADEKGASSTSGDSMSAKDSSASDLHPDVPDFIPGKPYGYGYDGAPATNACVELKPGCGQEKDKATVPLPDKVPQKVFCYADVVKTDRSKEFAKCHTNGKVDFSTDSVTN